jgi:hypothetical protein
MNNEELWLKCTKCNNTIPPVFEPEIQDWEHETYYTQIDDGVKLIFGSGYGMFTDNILRDNPTAFLCHDCVVELLEFFPESFRDQFKGGHPYSHKPNGRCCEYAWSLEDFKGEENNE